MTHPLLIKVLNVLAYVFLLSANVYSGFEGESGGSPYHNSHETYITPAPFVFGVWGLIHLLLGGFAPFAAQNWADKLFIHAPFSLYHAWIAVILVLSIFAALTPEKTDEDPILLVKIVVVIALFILKGLSVAYIEGFDSDIAGSIVIAWTLVGIFVEQQDPIIHWTALVLAIISIFHIVKGLITLYRKSSRSGEYAPLNP
ncbi:putative membrane permease [Gigaspora margarita]|uniref:Putative membrane permease n=1 Tax=Gigaspora margarita TaxID=4874 RepID=A0A8H4EJ99_GIGMA|nr:putative membrane permease [Gigaspora margarita]